MCEPSKFEPLILPQPSHVERATEARRLCADMPWSDWLPEPDWIDQRKRGAQADA